MSFHRRLATKSGMAGFCRLVHPTVINQDDISTGMPSLTRIERNLEDDPPVGIGRRGRRLDEAVDRLAMKAFVFVGRDRFVLSRLILAPLAEEATALNELARFDFKNIGEVAPLHHPEVKGRPLRTVVGDIEVFVNPPPDAALESKADCTGRQDRSEERRV